MKLGSVSKPTSRDKTFGLCTVVHYLALLEVLFNAFVQIHAVKTSPKEDRRVALETSAD